VYKHQFLLTVFYMHILLKPHNILTEHLISKSIYISINKVFGLYCVIPDYFCTCFLMYATVFLLFFIFFYI